MWCCRRCLQAAKEVSTALSLNYPSSADMAAGCGYERALDRCVSKVADDVAEFARCSNEMLKLVFQSEVSCIQTNSSVLCAVVCCAVLWW